MAQLASEQALQTALDSSDPESCGATVMIIAGQGHAAHVMLYNVPDAF
jgi:hypothetical protein